MSQRIGPRPALELSGLKGFSVMQFDAIVLGAGIVGVSVAVHLAQRGKMVALVDRRGAGEETSHGNAGLIQKEGVAPHAFPQGIGPLLAYARNDRIDMHYHATALPRIAPVLAQYWWHSRPENYARVKRAYAPLIAHSVSEHAPLIEAAGAGHLIEKKGWYKLYRTDAALAAGALDAGELARDFGVGQAVVTGDEMRRREPGLDRRVVGAIHWTDPWSVKDPNGLVRAYLALFESLGGRFIAGDAMRLGQRDSGIGWQMPTGDGVAEAAEVVVALGPWAGDLVSRFGYRLPLGVKRGYHMHYAQPEAHPLTSWVYDAERGYMLVPMQRGLRITTGAEFALRDAPPTPVQLPLAEAAARELFPLGQRLDTGPWMGSRPTTPDMMPIIGAAPRHAGLWFAFGHAHHGLTLGPATGRLIAELMTGEPTFVDPAPYAPLRFL